MKRWPTRLFIFRLYIKTRSWIFVELDISWFVTKCLKTIFKYSYTRQVINMWQRSGVNIISIRVKLVIRILLKFIILLQTYNEYVSKFDCQRQLCCGQRINQTSWPIRWYFNRQKFLREREREREREGERGVRYTFNDCFMLNKSSA